MRETQRKRRLVTRKYIYDYLLSHPCEQCWESRPVCLEFHHVNPENKRYSLSLWVSRDLSISTINKEIEKCQVLCSNCHKIVTAKEKNRYSFLNSPELNELHNEG